MNAILRTFAVAFATLLPLSAFPAESVAFVTNVKGEVAVDGVPRPVLMSELAKGQRINVAKEGQLAVMYVQSGKEYVLKGPGDYSVGEREITSASGMPPSARETPWRANNQVLVKVAQTSSASIRMRSIAPAKPEPMPPLEFPTQGSVTTLQPTLRWAAPAAGVPVEVSIAPAASEGRPVAKAKVTGVTWRVPQKLQAGTEYAWSVTAGGREIGSARFRTVDAATQQAVEKRRPTDKSEFTDRVLFALYLQEVGAIQESREAWGRLAQERADLPELASLAK